MLSIFNANSDFSLVDKIYGSKQSKTFELPLPTELAQRRFMNKKSNRWVSHVLQVLPLHYTFLNFNRSGDYFSQQTFHQYETKYDSTDVHHAI